jgi:Xaa-Pro aminopeptidase
MSHVTCSSGDCIHPGTALPHYSPEKGKDRLIDRTTPYVIDAGGQYLDGTVDTTRTM